MFWFDKKHPSVIYADKRREKHKLSNGVTLVIDPDVIMDFRKMPFKDNTFRLVVFDPPHTHAGQRGWFASKYGSLKSDWKELLKDGVDESFRVLKKHGVLIFKWNETHHKVSKVIDAIDREPLFGHRTMQNNNTIWLTFMKGVP